MFVRCIFIMKIFLVLCFHTEIILCLTLMQTPIFPCQYCSRNYVSVQRHIHTFTLKTFMHTCFSLPSTHTNFYEIKNSTCTSFIVICF